MSKLLYLGFALALENAFHGIALDCAELHHSCELCGFEFKSLRAIDNKIMIYKVCRKEKEKMFIYKNMTIFNSNFFLSFRSLSFL